MDDLTNKVAKVIADHTWPNLVSKDDPELWKHVLKTSHDAIKVMLNDLIDNGPKGPLTITERMIFNGGVITYAKENGFDID